MFFKSRRIISMLIVFVITFTYMGQTLQAIATTDGLSAITNGFFKNEEMEFKSYFQSENEQSKQKISNVNEKATLIFELSPKNIGQGFLKTGTILADTLDGTDINFKFTKIQNIFIDEPEEAVKYEGDNEELETDSENTDENIISRDEVIEEKNIVEQNTVKNTTIEDEFENTISENNVENETIENTITNALTQNTIDNAIETGETENIINLDNTIKNQVISRSSETRITEEIPNDLIDEAQVIENLEQSEIETYEELTAKDFEIEIIEDNQIKVQNVIHHTTIEVEIEYVPKEEFEIADLYQEISLKLSGTYIDINLEKIETEEQSNVFVGWNDEQEFEIAGEYTKFSSFQLGDHIGSIVENKIIVKRQTQDENYLPIKQSTIEIDVPDFQGKAPENINVQAQKLMATKGEEIGAITFGAENWKYDAQNKKIIITVENNGKIANTMGEDEYSIIYRYANDTQDEVVSMPNNFKVTVEEYSAKDNHIVTKEFSNLQNIKTQANNSLITYNIGSTEEALNKAKINANYYLSESMYETEFTTTVAVNILTNDVLEELKINNSKEVYRDNQGLEFDASSDIYYNKVKFNYSEIKEMLKNGATIEIQNRSNEVLYTLNSELIKNQDACDICLGNQEKGICVVFKNVASNGNISIEFTKVIGKSNYDKSAFNNFKEIKSYCQAELKYEAYEERYGMDEISAVKKLQNSKTVAEIALANNNLSTTAKNDGVEVRIILNNDKKDTDFYKNPSFELIFPKQVTNVTVEDIKLIYDCGLQIANVETFRENNIVKVKIDLNGTQTNFSESVLTNGTNIILNLNITLDEYTPKKQDQIKLYYCNEAVTNYEAQTKWTIQKAIPNGILRDTNGFDAAIVNYQAPTGLITANAIINYDGQASKIKSIDQGEKTAQIEEGTDSQIATMELVAMNNTKNICTDSVFLGRVPFEGNRSVITNEKLGSTATVKLLNGIQENGQNPNMTTIYYSTNENATKDLKNSDNGWTTNVEDWSEVKSYMIDVKGDLKEGVVLKYSYDFEIPQNLDYDEALYGSFGGFYNNHYPSLVTYEASEADLVGITTNSEPEQTVKITPCGDSQTVSVGQIVTLEAKVTNSTGSTMGAQELTVNLADNGKYKLVSTEHKSYDLETLLEESKESPQDEEIKKKIEELKAAGITLKEDEIKIYQMYVDEEVTSKSFEVPSLADGDSISFFFDVRVVKNSNFEEEEETDYSKLSGTAIYNGSAYDYNLTLENGMTILLQELNDIQTCKEGTELNFVLNVEKGEDNLKDSELIFSLPDYIGVSNIRLDIGNERKNIVCEEKDGRYHADIGTIEQNMDIYIDCKVKENNTITSEGTKVQAVFNITEKNDSDISCTYSSNAIQFEIKKMSVEVTHGFVEEPENEIDKTKTEYVLDYSNSGEEDKEFYYYKMVIKNLTNLEDWIEIDLNLKDNFFIKEISMDNEKVPTTTDYSFYKRIKLKANQVITIVAQVTVGCDENDIVEDISGKVIKIEGRTIPNQKVAITLDDGREIESNSISIRINELVNPKDDSEETEEEIQDEQEDDSDEALGAGEENFSQPNEDEEEDDETSENPIETDDEDGVVDQPNSNELDQGYEVPKYSIDGNIYKLIRNDLKDIMQDGTIIQEQKVELDKYGRVNEVKEIRNVTPATNSATTSAPATVQLFKGSTMVRATTTDSKGNYSFSDLEPGDYSIAFKYDNKIYTSRNTNNSSNAVETIDGMTVMDHIVITDSSIKNVDLELVEKDRFDLGIKQYITGATVDIKGEQNSYDFEDLTLAKIEIDPEKIADAVVKLNYKIVVENVGNVPGTVSSIVDYIPNGMTFYQAENPDWSIGAINGNIYYEGLKGINILPGETKEIMLTLTKQMTEENTGVVSNKVKIAYTDSDTRLVEITDNNFATQETIITVTQGLKLRGVIFFTISMIVIVTLFSYMVTTGKIHVQFNLKNGIKKVYK